MEKRKIKLIAQNKKAFFDFFIEETFQTGIELHGTEVKSLRSGKCNLKDSFIKIEKGEAFILNMHISPYEFGNIFNKDPIRKRKLLLHKKEINRLFGATTKDSFTIVPTKIYFNGSYVKLDIALAKGKKIHDKRRDIAQKDIKREAAREFKQKID
ncbi:MAG: SsrA-binding protein SmpB [Defluviitaleaceae bacterium]|nr:SsrA-binding protein SmpB [Defluviitaleaceae bacterium]